MSEYPLGQLIGKAIVEQRQAKGLSQAGLGRRQQVCGWEKGHHVPKVEQLIDLCITLGITPNDLLRYALEAAQAEQAKAAA